MTSGSRASGGDPQCRVLVPTNRLVVPARAGVILINGGGDDEE